MDIEVTVVKTVIRAEYGFGHQTAITGLIIVRARGWKIKIVGSRRGVGRACNFQFRYQQEVAVVCTGVQAVYRQYVIGLLQLVNISADIDLLENQHLVMKVLRGRR